MSPLGPVNLLYCLLIWSIYTIYISWKLGPGETYFKIENGAQAKKRPWQTMIIMVVDGQQLGVKFLFMADHGYPC